MLVCGVTHFFSTTPSRMHLLQRSRYTHFFSDGSPPHGYIAVQLDDAKARASP